MLFTARDPIRKVIKLDSDPDFRNLLGMIGQSKLAEPGMLVQACDLSTWKSEKPKASLGYLVSPYLRKTNTKWVSRVNSSNPIIGLLWITNTEMQQEGHGADWVLGQRRFLTGDGCVHLEQYQPALV